MPRINSGPSDHDETPVGAESDFAILGLGIPAETAVDFDEGAAAVSAHAALDLAAAVHGFKGTKVVLVDGTDVATNVTLAAVAVGDILGGVIALTAKADIATARDVTSEYAIGAGVLTKAAGTDETGNQLMVTFTDLT